TRGATPRGRESPLNDKTDLRHLLDALSDFAIFRVNASDCIESWTAGGERLTGYAPAEVIGQPVSFLHLSAQLLAHARARGRAMDEGWRARKDGTRFWADINVSSLGDGGAVAVVLHDRTEQHMNELDLRRSEERFHQLVDAVSDYAIFMLDALGHVAT